MADSDGKVRIIIDTNANEAEKALDDVTKSFNKNADTIQKASTVYNGYEKAIQENIQALKELAIGGNQNTEGFKKLAAETKKYKDMLNQADSAVNNATGGLNQQINPINSLTSKLAGLAASYISLRGVQMAFNYVMSSVDAYRTQERAVASFEVTLRNTGMYTAEYSQKIQNLASEIQSYSNYGDEAVIKAVALGQSFAGQIPITEKATKAVVDFAAATGMDLESAFTLFGKSVGSSTNALSRYGVELQKGMTDSQKMEAITKQLGDRYTGQAAKMADASVQLKNAIGDLSEVIGENLNPTISLIQRNLKGLTEQMTENIRVTRLLKTENADLGTMQNAVNKRIALEGELYKLEQKYAKGGTTTDYYNRRKGEIEQDIKLTQQWAVVFAKQQQQQEQANKKQKVIKNTDDYNFPTSTGNISTSNTQKIKDEYEKLQEAVQKARREVELTALAHGTSSEKVQKAFTRYKELNTQLTAVGSLFDNQKTKINEQSGAYQQLQDKITVLKAELMNMYVSGQSNSALFVQLKNQLVQYENLAKNANTAVTSQVGLDWTNTFKTLKSQLSNALLTPLQEGESAFERLQNVAFTVIQAIAQEMLEKFIFEEAIKGIQNYLGSLTSTTQQFQTFSESMASTTQAAQSMSGAMNWLGSSQAQVGTILSSTANELAGASQEYGNSTIEALKLAAAQSQIAIADAADSAAKIPYVGWALAPVAATLTGAAIAAGTAMTTGAAALGGMFAKGGVFENGSVTAFANGGVVSQPTYFPMAGGQVGLMGEAGAEAIMPLKRSANGKLGVQATTTPANVNIYNYSDNRIETIRRPDGDTDIFIRRVNAALSSERTQSGFQKALQRNNNIGLQAS